MGLWTLDDIPWHRFDRYEARSRDRPHRQGGGSGRAQRRGLCPSSVPDFRRRSGVPGNRAALGRGGDPARPGAGALGGAGRPRFRFRPGVCPVSGRFPGRFRQRPLAPRLARRRDGGALHRRDWHQLLLHRAARGGGRAGTAGDLPAYRRRRVAPLPAVLQKPRPLPGDGSRSGGSRGCASRSGGSPNRKTTNWPTPITPPMRASFPMTGGATPGPMRGAPLRSTGRTMSSAASRCC